MLGNEQERNMKEKRRCAMKMPPSAPSSEGALIKYVCGIDIASHSCVAAFADPTKAESSSRSPLPMPERAGRSGKSN
jgi:hypothetical protein